MADRFLFRNAIRLGWLHRLAHRKRGEACWMCRAVWRAYGRLFVIPKQSDGS